MPRKFQGTEFDEILKQYRKDYRSIFKMASNNTVKEKYDAKALENYYYYHALKPFEFILDKKIDKPKNYDEIKNMFYGSMMDFQNKAQGLMLYKRAYNELKAFNKPFFLRFTARRKWNKMNDFVKEMEKDLIKRGFKAEELVEARKLESNPEELVKNEIEELKKNNPYYKEFIHNLPIEVTIRDGYASIGAEYMCKEISKVNKAFRQVYASLSSDNTGARDYLNTYIFTHKEMDKDSINLLKNEVHEYIAANKKIQEELIAQSEAHPDPEPQPIISTVAKQTELQNDLEKDVNQELDTVSVRSGDSKYTKVTNIYQDMKGKEAEEQPKERKVNVDFKGNRIDVQNVDRDQYTEVDGNYFDSLDMPNLVNDDAKYHEQDGSGNLYDERDLESLQIEDLKDEIDKVDDGIEPPAKL